MKTQKAIIPGILTLLGILIGIRQRILSFKFREGLGVYLSGELSAETHTPAGTHRLTPFTVEVMVSAGPRKGAREYEADPENAELCEDCAGSTWIGPDLIIWDADGSTNPSNTKELPRLHEKAESERIDAPKVQGFSTRAWAKDLGQAFVTHAAAALQTGGHVPPTLPQTAFTELATQWEERLNAYLSLVERRGLRDQLLAQLPQTLRFEWSATFTGGIFRPETKQLTVWNFGNAGGLVATAPPQVISPNTTYVTLVVALERQVPLRACVQLSPLTNITPTQYINVEGFALLSDGMERFRLDDLLTRLQNDPINSLAEFRLGLLQKADLTWDDKSLVIGRFLEVGPCASRSQTGAETKRRSSLNRTVTTG